MSGDRLKYIAVKLHRCTVFLTTEEAERLLRLGPELYGEAIEKGRAALKIRRGTGERNNYVVRKLPSSRFDIV